MLGYIWVLGIAAKKRVACAVMELIISYRDYEKRKTVLDIGTWPPLSPRPPRSLQPGPDLKTRPWCSPIKHKQCHRGSALNKTTLAS